VSDPRSPWFVAPPPPPPPEKGPSRGAGLKIVAITLGILVGVAGAAVVVLPYALDRKSHNNDEQPPIEKPKKPKTPPKDDKHAKAPTALPILPSDPVRGDDRALVTIVEFGDFQDPFTARLEPTLDALRTKYGKDLRVVWKDYPLTFHKDARPAAKAARVAMLEGGPAKFFKLHDKIIANQKDLATELDTWATDVGADLSAMGRHSKRADELLDASVQLAKDLGVPGTPHCFVDGEKIGGARPQADFEKLIDAHITEAKKLLSDGVKQEDLYAELVDRHYDDIDPTAGGTLYNVDVTGASAVGPADSLVTAVVFVDPEHVPLDAIPMSDLVGLADTRVAFRDLPSTPKGTEASAILKLIGDKVGMAERVKAIDEVWAKFPSDLVTFAIGHGVSGTDAKAAIAGAMKLKSLDDDRDAADEVDAAISPQSSMFINGRRQYSFKRADVTATITREKKRAERLVLKGTAKADVYAEIVKKGTRKPRKHVTMTVPAYAPTKGPASAPVVIHVFSDFQCPFCKRAMDPTTGGFAAAVAAHSSDVKVVYRHNPLTFHTMAEPAAQMTIEAKKQKGVGAFWRVHDKLYAVIGTLDMAKIEAIAIGEGLDLTKVRAAISGHLHKKEIDDDVAETRRISAFGTPAFVVGDELISGAQTQAVFEAAIKRAKAKASP
jgi:protein-disulfide isomerase